MGRICLAWGGLASVTMSVVLWGHGTHAWWPSRLFDVHWVHGPDGPLNSDMLFFPMLYEDMVSGYGALGGWNFPPSSELFPMFPVYCLMR